jgi:ankyrin repeat protein
MYSDNLQVTKALLEAGSSVSQASMPYRVLNMVCMHRKLDIIEYVVSLGADINAKDRYGRTPLMSAFRQDKDHTKTDSSNLPDIVDFLLSSGAYVDSVDVYGESALHYAMRYAGAQDDNYLTAVQKLVQAGGVALANSRSRIGVTPLQLVKSVHVARILVDAGAEVNLCLKREESPLCRACLNNLPEVAQFLLDNKADITDVSLCDVRGRTALFSVVVSDRTDFVQLLINAGADINSYSSGYTPLIWAATHGMVVMCAVLLGAGANARLYGPDGRYTTLMEACRSEEDVNPLIIVMLLNAGADKDIDKYYKGVTVHSIARQNWHVPRVVNDILAET